MYTLKTSTEIARLIRHSHPLLKRKLKGALQIILDDPASGKALKEELEGLRS